MNIIELPVGKIIEYENKGKLAITRVEVVLWPWTNVVAITHPMWMSEEEEKKFIEDAIVREVRGRFEPLNRAMSDHETKQAETAEATNTEPSN